MSQVQEKEASYAEVTSPPMAKEKFDMEINGCYDDIIIAPKKKAVASNGNKNVIIAQVVIMVLVGVTSIAVSCIGCIAFPSRFLN